MSRKILNKQLKKKIAELVSTGLDVVQALQSLGNPVQPNTVYKEQVNDKEFASLLDTAYTSYVMIKLSEYNALASKSPQELYPDLDPQDAKEKRKGLERCLQFTLKTMAPHLAKRYDKASKVEHSGVNSAGITIIVPDYSVPMIETKDDKPLLN